MASESGVPLKDLSPDAYARLSGLLDEALELSGGTRAAWLARLAEREPQIAMLVGELLDSQGAAPGEAFLEDRASLLRELVGTTTADQSLVGRVFGPYRVCSILGQGGMGSVWVAERIDGLFTRQVALKLVHPALTSHAIAERFAREREILAGLNHPNIARLLDAGLSDDGQAYLALEYVRGTPFTTYCDDHRLPLRARLELFRKVLGAVQYAHAHLVIHRDLKPSNILVSEQGEVHLLDFGIAKLLTEGEARETRLTRLGGVALTPDYAAPEQIAGVAITTAADVYALGVMLYEVLTGERPYKLKRETRGALEEAILQTNPVTPSRRALHEMAAQARRLSAPRLRRALKGDLDTIVLKALKKAPSERYATANAFDEDLARFLRGDVVLAQPDRFAYRALKFAQRHRTGISVASLLVLTLAAGLAATSYEARVAALQRDVALEAQRRSLTQTAAARLQEADAAGALSIALELLPRGATPGADAADVLNVFQEARAADAQIVVFSGHTDRVRGAAFSGDGRRVITASDDKTARIWDAETGLQIQLLTGHNDPVNSAAFSPDGKRAATASSDRTARIWDVTTGRQIELLSGHTDAVLSVAFSPDGRRLVTASADRTARIWDAETGRQLGLLRGHRDWVESAAFSPDGKRIATASRDKTVRIWDAATARELLRLSGHTDVVNSVGFSPDGGRLITTSTDKTGRIWDVASGREIRLLSGSTHPLAFGMFSPDGRRVVTAGLDKTARIWDLGTGQVLRVLSGHTDALISAAFSPDGRRVVTASYDRTARIWDATPAQQLLLFGEHSSQVISGVFSPDGRHIVTASADGAALVWDAATARVLQALRHNAPVTSAAFSPDGRRIVTASLDKTARLWDIATGRETLRLSGHTRTVNSAAFSPDGGRIVTASYDKTARIWDAVTGRQTLLLSGHTDLLTCAVFSPDGRRIATGAYDGTARLWDAASGRQTLILIGHAGAVNSVEFSPDGRQIVTASADKTSRIWDAASGRQIMLFTGHGDIVESAAFSPDGRRIVTASDDRTVRIWEVATGREMLVLNGHAGYVESAAFAPDGGRIVTTSYDETARIWDARTPPLGVQIALARAAEFDPLTGSERFQLGLPAASDVRNGPDDATTCDRSAAAYYDPDRRAPGVMLDQIAPDIAIQACSNDGSGDPARAIYQRGRAFLAGGKLAQARSDFEEAVNRGYHAARIDLAMLLSQPSDGMLDVARAVSLYEQAWRDRVIIAGFALGSLYEHGVSGPGRSESLLPADPNKARDWYRKAAAAGEPSALARLAEQEERNALLAVDTVQQRSHWLAAFGDYAAAAELARREDWPDDAWRDWRHRRASIARMLARAGLEEQVAHLYESVRGGTHSGEPTFW